MKNKTKDEAEHASIDKIEKPTWYEVGEGNPFDQPILDIRSVTLYMVAATREKSIAENFTNSRSDDGKQYIDQEIQDGVQYDAAIKYPHNGAMLEGIVSKAESMDVKWDYMPMLNGSIL